MTTDSSGLATKPLPLSPVLVEAQLNLARGWKSMLVVGSMDHVSMAMGVAWRVCGLEGLPEANFTMML